MSRFDLRDVSSRVTRSRDAKAVAFEFLRSLESARPEWRASLAFYEVSRDAFVDVLEIDGERLIRREIVVSTKDLPQTLVRKLFGDPPSANPPKKKALFSVGLGSTPQYTATLEDTSKLMPLTVLSEWRSCICLPLGDQSDLMGILVIVSAKANAFSGRAVGEILPVKSLVTTALARHLRRTQASAVTRRPAGQAGKPAGTPATPGAQQSAPAPATPAVSQAAPAAAAPAAPQAAPAVAGPATTAASKAAPAAATPARPAAPPAPIKPAPSVAPAKPVLPIAPVAPPVAPAFAQAADDARGTPDSEDASVFEAADEMAAALRAEFDDLAKRSGDDATPDATTPDSAMADHQDVRQELDEYRTQLELAKSEMAALEAEAVDATEVLTATYAEMNETSWQMADLERRMGFARHCLRVLGEEPDEQSLPEAFVSWLSDDLGVERCSLMTPDESGEVLRIAAQRGIDAAVTAQVCVRLGQGVAGWVALNRKPLLVRMRSQAEVTPAAQSTTYNSESFIAVPVVHNGRLYGVLNLSNKRGGELFSGVDFDCASLAGAALALRLSSVAPSRGAMARAA
jgi:putative methionine-R-sulfoxide reductase with GAF domain